MSVEIVCAPEDQSNQFKKVAREHAQDARAPSFASGWGRPGPPVVMNILSFFPAPAIMF